MSAKMDVTWIPCSSHKIQLCINKALDRTPPAKAVIGKCQNISTFFRGCSAAMAALGKAQERLQLLNPNGSALKLLAIVPTRWNSYYDMAERVLKICDAISQAHNNMPSATKAEQSKCEELGRLLLSDNMRSRVFGKSSGSWNRQPPSRTGLEGQATQLFHKSLLESTACSQRSTRSLRQKQEDCMEIWRHP